MMYEKLKIHPAVLLTHSNTFRFIKVAALLAALCDVSAFAPQPGHRWVGLRQGLERTRPMNLNTADFKNGLQLDIDGS